MGKLPDYMTQAIYAKEFTNLSIIDFSGAPAQPFYPAIDLLNGRSVILRNNRVKQNNLTLLRQKNILP